MTEDPSFEDFLKYLFSGNGWVLATVAIATIVPFVEHFCEGCIKRFFKRLYGDLKSLFHHWRHPPALPLESPTGPVPLNSPWYVEFPHITSQWQPEIVKSAALIRVKAPRQMGKTSLMKRMLDYAYHHGPRTVFFSFEKLNVEVFATPETFLQYFCASLTDELGFPPFQVAQHWQGELDCNMKCDRYFREQLLLKLDRPLVIGLDEVDSIFPYSEVAKEFFKLLRAWHVDGVGGNIPAWEKLKFVITHSQEVYASLSLELNQSPFNVGVDIQLPEFDLTQVQTLVQCHGLVWQTKPLQRLMKLIGGHPYLVRKALFEISRGPSRWRSFLKKPLPMRVSIMTISIAIYLICVSNRRWRKPCKPW